MIEKLAKNLVNLKKQFASLTMLELAKSKK